MAKNKGFGNVLPVLLCSLSLISLPSFSHGLELTEAYEALNARKTACFLLGDSGHKQLPKDDWVSQLNEDNKQAVLSYVAQKAFNDCLTREVAHLERVLAKQSDDVKALFTRYIAIEPYLAQRPMQVDQGSLDRFESKIHGPFKVSEALNVYE
ncbi:hypothetical protein [Vibrio sp. TBV020]|uniref:hypothetical protein n=1 Tax=Vibrio sp. TBV020 TaxID=3137398 RepID=UPI0038CD99EE